MAKLTKPIDENDHVLGPEKAAYEIVEYGDFECPYCGAAYPVLKDLLHRMGDQIRFAYRSFPLSEVHPHAEAAAEAAESAAAQGKFWEMHDYLFEHQKSLTNRSLLEYAQAVGLDVQQFQEDLESRRFAEKVHEEFLSGVYSGVNGTPTLYINGLRYEGAVELEELVAALEEVQTR